MRRVQDIHAPVTVSSRIEGRCSLNACAIPLPYGAHQAGDDLLDAETAGVERDMRARVVTLPVPVQGLDLLGSATLEHRAAPETPRARKQLVQVAPKPDHGAQLTQHVHAALAARQAPAGRNDVVRLEA